VHRPQDYAVTSGDEPEPELTKRTQMNVRIPANLIAAIDARRGPLKISRDEYVERCIRFALSRARTPRRDTTRTS
jgi:hypothetical protein